MHKQSDAHFFGIVPSAMQTCFPYNQTSNRLRKMRNTIYRKLSSKLSRKNEKKIVSFDIFDTVLLRMVDSKDVIRLSANKLSGFVCANTGIDIAPKSIIDSRNDFERHKKDISAEWTLSEWLDNFAKSFGIDPFVFRELGRKAEFEAEINGLSLNLDIFPIIKKLQAERSITTIAISDIWHDEEILRDILGHFGMRFDSVYTSGTRKASKSKRTIFHVVEKEHPGYHFLHIGDNLISDRINPRIQKWESIWTPKPHPFFPFWIPKPFWKGPLKPKPENTIAKLLESKKQIEGDGVYRLGYYFLAPLLVIFSLIQWKIFQENGIGIAFFIARDAKIPFEVYERISRLFPEGHTFVYCRLSRKAVGLLLPDRPLNNALPMPGKAGRKTVGEWLSNFSIGDDLKRKILREAGISSGHPFDRYSRSRIKKSCAKYETDIQREKDRLAEMVMAYLADLGGTDLDRIGLVDTGWAGTIQDCLRNALKDTRLVCGVYLGVGDQGRKPDDASKKYGMLRDDYKDLCSIIRNDIDNRPELYGHLCLDTDFGIQPVHRLDKETSGVLLLAADRETFTHFFPPV